MFRRSPTRRARRLHTDDAERRLTALIDEHAESIYRMALSIVKDRALAEDVVQETLIKAWTNLDSFRGEGSARSWILSIAHNTAISTLRRIREESTAPDNLPDQPALTSDVEQSVEQREHLDDLWQAVGRLDDLSRAILILRDVEGLSYQAIADSVGVAVPTVKTRLLRARRELQRVSVSGDVS